jgi:putative transposase
MVHYRINFVPGRTYFFTVTLADRRSTLLIDRIDALGAAFRQCRSSHPFETLAIAVMPDHLHCIWTLPDGDADYAIRWSLVKRAFTRRQYHEGPTPARAKRGVWQARFREHTIRDEVDLQRHIDYIHFNPVKHSHARRAADWPHSSFHRYVRHGFVAEDWASDAEDDPAEFGEMGRQIVQSRGRSPARSKVVE